MRRHPSAVEAKPGDDLPTPSTFARYGDLVWWRKKTDVSEFLYKLLVGDAPRGYAKQVADKMRVPYSTLSKYWLGKRRFPAALVRPLFAATGEDARVAEFFVLAGSKHRLVRIAEDEAPVDLPRAVMTLASLEAKVTDLYLRATAPDSEDGKRVSEREAEALRTAVHQLIVHAERLRAALA